MTLPSPLALALPLLQLLLGGLALRAFQGPRHPASLRWWGWGLMIGAAGMLLTLTIGEAVFPALGGVLIAAAYTACFAGAIGQKRVRLRKRYRIAGFFLCVIPGLVSAWFPVYFAIVQMAAVMTITFGLLVNELRKLEGNMDRLMTADPVTGLPNRRATEVRLKDEVARAARHDRTFALVVLQVNLFPQIRKMRGAMVGDAVVGHVAETVRAAMRDEDVMSRIGDEALVLLLPEQLAEGALTMADRLCELVAATPCRYDAWPLNLTLSRGVAVYPTDGRDWDALFGAASRRMLPMDAKGNPGRPRMAARA